MLKSKKKQTKADKCLLLQATINQRRQSLIIAHTQRKVCNTSKTFSLPHVDSCQVKINGCNEVKKKKKNKKRQL